MQQLLTLAAALLSSAAVADEPPVEPTSVVKVFSDGQHNAFTALVRWKEAYWLAFRNGPSHGYGEADIVVLRSSDAEQWTEALRLNTLPDDRDPQFLATDGRLFLYVPSLEGARLTSFVSTTDDGQAWSQPQPVYEPQFIFWKPRPWAEGFLATAHKKSETATGGAERQAHLIRSADGLAWEKVSTIRAGNWESETTVLTGPGERLTAFLRTKYSVPGSILEAEPPYDTWTERPAGVHLSGHSVHEFGGTTYLFSRTMDESGGNQGAMIYTYVDGQLTPYCRLPASGDSSYPEAVELGDEMLVSYYSEHEGPASIYLARVPIR
jgi:hypothetical protein